MNALLEIPEVRARISLLSVDEYHRQREFNERGKRTELLRGMVIEKMSKTPLHSTVSSRLHRILLGQAKGQLCRKKEPLTFADSEPEPDLSVVTGTESDFASAHPTTALFVAEVAVSSAAWDRENANLYAENGVGEYWIVLPRERSVEVYRQPVAGRYREMRLAVAPEILISSALLGVSVDLSELFAGLS